MSSLVRLHCEELAHVLDTHTHARHLCCEAIDIAGITLGATKVDRARPEQDPHLY